MALQFTKAGLPRFQEECRLNREVKVASGCSGLWGTPNIKSRQAGRETGMGGEKSGVERNPTMFNDSKTTKTPDSDTIFPGYGVEF